MAKYAEVRARVGSSSIVLGTKVGASIEVLDPRDEPIAELLLSGAGAGLVEYARGRAVLHGSAVAFRGRGLALVGSSGAGKSTLAAWLHHRGWKFVSDAMSVVEPGSRTLVPQPRRFRLKDDSLTALGWDPNTLPVDDVVTQKRTLPCGDDDMDVGEVQLLTVVVLGTDSELSIVELGAADAMMALVIHAYLSSCLEPDRSPELLPLAALLVRSGVRVFSLTYPLVWEVLPTVEGLLERIMTNTPLLRT